MASSRGIKADRARSYAELERVAVASRRILVPGTPVSDPADPIELFESLERFTVKVGGVSVPLTFEVRDLGPGILGETRYVANDNKIAVALSVATYQDLENKVPRAAFSLAHEVGHAVIHPNELKRLSMLPVLSGSLLRMSQHKTYFDTEWQADAYAASLLVPAEGVYELELQLGRDILASELARQYGISREAAALRLKIYRDRKGELLPKK